MRLSDPPILPADVPGSREAVTAGALFHERAFDSPPPAAVGGHRRRSEAPSKPRSVRRAPTGRYLAVALLVLAVFAPPMPAAQAGSSGEFHTSCAFSHAAADDPIVFPGEPGMSHLHDFFGNRTTNADSTFRSMRRGRTTCSSSADASGYWSPALLDPRGNVVTPRTLAAYYRAQSRVDAPPRNLRVIAGGDTRDLRVAGYACGEGTPTSSVPVDCGSKLLKGVIVFPSCWNGEDLDSRDHRSHMAYPTGKGCPRRYPVRIPKLVLHITYGIHDGAGYTLVSDEMMGMRDGMSLHADFWNTWRQRRLERVVERCVNGGLSCDL
jgi:hypothetical protein